MTAAGVERPTDRLTLLLQQNGKEEKRRGREGRGGREASVDGSRSREKGAEGRAMTLSLSAATRAQQQASLSKVKEERRNRDECSSFT